MTADPWEVLGVPSTATVSEARRAYAAKALLLHPDKHPGATGEVLARAQEAMSELNAAWRAVEGRPEGTGTGGEAGPSSAARSGRRPPDNDEARLALTRNLESADAALDLVRATRQLRETTLQSLLRRYDRTRLSQLNTQLDEMLRHAEARSALARRELAQAEAARDRFGSRRRLVRHHRLAVRVHDLAVQCHQRLLLAAPVDDLVTEVETIVAAMQVVAED